MAVTYREGIKQSGQFHVLAQQATKLLEEVLGPAVARASAEWDREEDERGRDLVTLKLVDDDSMVNARFAPDEMLDSGHMYSCLLRLWGDVLQDRSHRLLKKVRKLGDVKKRMEEASRKRWTVVWPILVAVVSILLSALVSYFITCRS